MHSHCHYKSHVQVKFLNFFRNLYGEISSSISLLFQAAIRSKELKFRLSQDSTTVKIGLNISKNVLSITVLYSIFLLVSAASFISKYLTLILTPQPALYKIILSSLKSTHRVLILCKLNSLCFLPASLTWALNPPGMIIPKPFASQQGNDVKQAPSYFCFCFSILPHM